ncbi:MAG: 4-hydroxybenzoate octaprenyltransferase [Alphaproteobacteria bacterium]|nr:4-hydroxybenzoate octaprenyltransferase [Alphaproteobacteria bacterium]
MVISKIRPLIHLCRLDKPIGIWLLMIPCWWGVALVFQLMTAPFFGYLLLFFVGSICMRSAGCISNDIADRNYDRDVQRTALRPLAAETITVTTAIIVFIFFCLSGLLAFAALSQTAQIISLVAFVMLLFYPYAKRVTYWPQLVLGLAFNSGVIVAWGVDATPSLLFPVIVFYTIGILWTLAYDTIYAFQDVTDDIRIGIKSTAVLFKDSPKKLPALCYGGMILLLVTSGILFQYSASYFVIVSILACVSGYILGRWTPEDQESCLGTFKTNQILGWLIFLALLIR